MIKIDKILHFIAGFTIYKVGNIFTDKMIQLFFLVIVIAFLKELYDDLKYGGFDNKDLFVTILGGIIASLI